MRQKMRNENKKQKEQTNQKKKSKYKYINNYIKCKWSKYTSQNT